MNYKNPINHPSVAFKRKSIVAIGDTLAYHFSKITPYGLKPGP